MYFNNIQVYKKNLLTSKLFEEHANGALHRKSTRKIPISNAENIYNVASATGTSTLILVRVIFIAAHIYHRVIYTGTIPHYEVCIAITLTT